MKDKIKLLFKDIDFNKKGVGLKIKSIINEYLDVKEYLNNELKIYPMYDSYFYIIRTIFDNLNKNDLIKCKTCRKTYACKINV